jgi:hypothetical protein
MKNIFQCFVILLSLNYFSASAQNIIGCSFGVNRPAGMTTAIDVLAPFYGAISYAHYFKINKLLSRTPAIEWNGSSYIMDGRFTKTSGKYLSIRANSCKLQPEYALHRRYKDAYSFKL